MKRKVCRYTQRKIGEAFHSKKLSSLAYKYAMAQRSLGYAAKEHITSQQTASEYSPYLEKGYIRKCLALKNGISRSGVYIPAFKPIYSFLWR